MPSKIKIIITCSLMVILFCACKKYPEDAKFPWQTVQKRLTSHSWYIKQFNVNDADSTYNTFSHLYGNGSIVMEYWTYLDTKFEFSLNKMEATSSGAEIYVVTKNNIIFENPCYWRLKSDDNQIELNLEAANNAKWQFFNCATNNWTIKKLTDKEFIIENTSALGKLYRVKFQDKL